MSAARSQTVANRTPAGVDEVTRTVRAAIESDRQFGAVAPPLYLSANYTFEGLGERRQYDYTRTANPTRDQLAQALAELEGGAGAVVTSSGMSAIVLVWQLLRPGDLLVAPHDCYGGTFRAMQALASKQQFRLAVVDMTDAAALDAALAQRPRLVWVETPSNPLLRVTDLRAVVARAHAVGALVAADNTFLSPVLQKPLHLGADVVVHSTTKYLNGHSDVVGGAVIARDAALCQELAWWANCLGLTGAPFDSFLTLRGLRTLHARIALHEHNAGEVARFLARQEGVRAVHWPGLATHPGHAVARAQQQGFGGMLSFELDGDAGAVAAFLDGLRCFSLAESLGGVESLVAHPATMTHAAMDAAARRAAGISDALLRLSVGIESADDLVADLAAGLRRAAAVRRVAHDGAAVVT